MSDTHTSTTIVRLSAKAQNARRSGGVARYVLAGAALAVAGVLGWLAWAGPLSDDLLADPVQRGLRLAEQTRLLRIALGLGAALLALSAWHWVVSRRESPSSNVGAGARADLPGAGQRAAEAATPVDGATNPQTPGPAVERRVAAGERGAALAHIQQAMRAPGRRPDTGLALLYLAVELEQPGATPVDGPLRDDVQRALAQRLRQALRPLDYLAHVDSALQSAEAGIGSEWIVLLDGVQAGLPVQTVATRLSLALVEPLSLHGKDWRCEARIGAALWFGEPEAPSAAAPQAGAPAVSDGVAAAELLLRQADTALYAARQSGTRACVFYRSELRESVSRVLQNENDLRRGLQAGEMGLTYQPVVDLGSGRLVAVQAAVVWDHPLRGVQDLADLFDMDEHSPLQAEIGAQFFRQACADFAQCKRELGARAPAQLWVSLAASQMRGANAVTLLKTVLAEEGLEPSCLQLGVTESLAARDEAVQACLTQLKTLGVRLALDRFGSGFSSMARLHQLPIDVAKVDAQFIQRIEKEPDYRVLIEAIVRVARGQGIVTVAPGVCNQAQATVLRALRCELALGAHFGAAVSAREFAAWCAPAQAAGSV